MSTELEEKKGQFWCQTYIFGLKETWFHFPFATGDRSVMEVTVEVSDLISFHDQIS